MSDELAALVQYRLEQADAALNDAKYLLDGCRSPHSIVNRAYYAMFYAALALLQKAGKIPSKHAGAIGLFDTEFVVKGAFPCSYRGTSTRLSNSARRPTTGCSNLPREKRRRKPGSGQRVLFTR